MAQNDTIKKSSIGKDAMFLTVSKFMVSVLGLVTSMLLARFRSLDEYGSYSQIIMVTDLVSSILLLGIPNSINYFLAKADTDEERRKFLSVYTTITTILTGIIGLCLFFATPIIISYFNNPLIADFAYVFAVYPWSTMFINSIGSVCIVYGRANKLIFYNLANAVTVLAVLMIAKVANLSFQQYMLMYMAVLVLFAIIGIFWSKKLAGGLALRLDFSLIKDIFAFSIPIGLASAAGTISVELDKLVIGKFFSVDEYAIFANAAKELPVTIVATSITAVLLPQLVRILKRGNNLEAVDLWGHAISVSMCFMCLLVGGFIVFAPDIISLLYSEKYVTTDSIFIFRIYSIILVFRSVYWGIILNATGNTKFIFYSSLITLLCNFVGNIASYYILGFVGPAVTTLLVKFVINYVQLKFTSNVIKVPLRKLLPWRSIFRILFVTGVFCVAFWCIKYLLLDNYERSTSIIISIGLGVVWTIIYALVNLRFVKRSWNALNEHKI